MKFEIRDENGVVYNRVENPAAVFDSDSGTLLRVGDREAMLAFFNLTNEKYRMTGFHDIANAMVYMELPKNQQEIDRVFQITGYIKNLYEKSPAGKSAEPERSETL